MSHKAIGPVMGSIGIKAFEHYIQGVSVYLEYGSGGPDFDSCYGHDCYLVGRINALEVLAKTPLYAEG
ncbi:MAG: hypothetical protein ACREYE_21190 [Gammaproteobacteria bacterium]